MRRVLVLSDDDSARQTLQLSLRSQGYEALGVASVEDARRVLATDPIHAIIAWSPLLPPASSPLFPAPRPPLLIAILPPNSPPAAGLAAMQSGADDFVIESPDLLPATTLALKKSELRKLYPSSSSPSSPSSSPSVSPSVSASASALPPSMVGASPPMSTLATAIRKVAPFKATVFINGESGTGKELIARALHQQSSRAAGPFVAVNCGAIPAGLMESELLGHSKGSFTDALRDRAGLLEQASGGTLFLDEIAELPLAMQVKLLRVLQDDSVRRLGDDEERPVDVRLVAATNRDLEAEVAARRFREDLFHRINVVALRVPPLRERRDDIPLLVAHFIARANQRLGLALRGVSAEAMRVLVDFAWPGNVRELENTVERAAVMCEGDEIDLASLPERILRDRAPSSSGATAGTMSGATAGTTAGDPTGASALAAIPGRARDENGDGILDGNGDGEDLSIKRAARRAEEDLIRRALVKTGGNRTRAAELLEISHRALLYKIKEFGVVLPMTPTGPNKDEKF
jgi:two-component system response regulator AtoC